MWTGCLHCLITCRRHQGEHCRLRQVRAEDLVEAEPGHHQELRGLLGRPHGGGDRQQRRAHQVVKEPVVGAVTSVFGSCMGSTVLQSLALVVRAVQ